MRPPLLHYVSPTMQPNTALRLLLIPALSLLIASVEAVNPLQKVLQLLTDLETKVTADGERELNAYKEYAEWCKGSSRDKAFEIQTAKSDIEDLTATIGKAQSDVSAAVTKIEELGAAIAANDGDLKAATNIREKEQADFMSVEKELMESVDTIDRAIRILDRNMKGSSLVQQKVDTRDVSKLVQTLSVVVDAASLSLLDKRRLVALAQSSAGANHMGADASVEDEDDLELGAPTAAAYKAHSENIVDVLEDLREKAQKQLDEARREEVAAKHNYEMLKQSLSDQMVADDKELSEEKAEKASAGEVQATAEGDLAKTELVLTDAEKALEQLEGGCKSAAGDHEASMKGTAEELRALAEAKRALLESTSGAEGSVYNASSFLQLLGSHEKAAGLSTRADLVNFEVVNLVRQLAKKHHSAALNQLATKISSVIKYGAHSGEDPFAKVKALITELIARLEKEAGAEESHKAYCDKEMAATKEKIGDLTASSEGLTAKMDKKKALSVKLKGEVNQKLEELAELVKSQAAMDNIRKEEKEAFIQKKTDLEQGLQGVRAAMKVLRDYYASRDESEAATALLQGQQVPDSPTYHSKSSDVGAGIIEFLEVIETDFGRSLAQSESDEDSAEQEYQAVSQQNQITKAVLDSDVKYKTKEAAELDRVVSQLASDRNSAQAELDAVLEYSEGIRRSCVSQPSTYEERKARREAEVAGLREALQILETEASLLQRPRRGVLGLRGAGVKEHRQ